MILPLWGALEKAQDDAQTIEEAIIAAVAAHEADAEAHLGAGESLAAHKAQDVIDHPQGSILTDKWTHSELDFATTFESLAPFFTDGTVIQIWPGFATEADGTGTANKGGLQVDGESGNLPFNTANDMLVQFSFSIDGGANDTSQMRMGPFAYASPTAQAGMGVQVVGDQLTFFAGSDDGATLDTLTAQTINYLQTYIVRLFNNTNSGEIECYLDGELIGVLEWPVTDYSDYANVMMWTWTSASSSAVLNVKSLYFSTTP